MRLRYWLVTWWHECDYPSRGTQATRIVAAMDADEAKRIADAPRDTLFDNGGEVTGSCWERSVEAWPLELPDLSRRRKPFVVV